jgi:cell division protein FtsW
MATPVQATKYNELGGRVDVWMLCAVAALIGLGIVMVASSSMSYAVMTGQGAFYYFNRHLMFLVIGL